METWTRDRPAGAKHGAMLLQVRHVRCVVKCIVFGLCILKLEFYSATYWAHVNERDFSELSFMMFLFMFNVCVRHFAVCLIVL